MAKTDREHLALLAVLRENMIVDTPEAELVIAVLAQAVYDAHLSVGAAPAEIDAREDALMWLHGDECRYYCDLLGIEASYYRKLAARFAALVKDKRDDRRRQHAKRMETRYGVMAS